MTSYSKFCRGCALTGAIHFGNSPEDFCEICESPEELNEESICSLNMALVELRDAARRDVLEFQSLVKDFTLCCFGTDHTFDKLARADRFVEEVYELLQSLNYPRHRLNQLEHYVWSRSIGTTTQEVGGVSMTFNALCTAHGIKLIDCALDELKRCWDNLDTISAKEASKKSDSALPGKD